MMKKTINIKIKIGNGFACEHQMWMANNVVSECGLKLEMG